MTTEPKVTNTQALYDSPEARFVGLMGGYGGRIEAMEARGQAELVKASSVLPIEIGGGQQALGKAGVVFHGPVDGDPLFQKVTLPEGWQKAATDHYMWSNLLDDKGRERAAIFYKAAPYDRRAHLNVTCRYTAASKTSTYQPDQEHCRPGFDLAIINRDGKPVHTFEVASDNSGWSDAGRKAALAWLKENKPEYADPAAYWDEE